jgi:xyloglucan-specific endo-beta-1,4-glucanase
MKSSLVTAMAAATVATASASDFCGQWDLERAGNYLVYNNLWGLETPGTTGGQCTGVDSVDADGKTLAWHTSYTWGGETWQVKSYANVALQFTPVLFSDIASIPTTVEYEYIYEQEPIGNVAYDFFTSSASNGTNEYEIMVWLAQLSGAWPLTTTGSTPIANETVGGVEFGLFKGFNGNVTVFSFVAHERATKFDGDYMAFVDHLVANQGFPTTQYLTSAGFGTEPFIGTNATLAVSKYSVEVVPK